MVSIQVSNVAFITATSNFTKLLIPEIEKQNDETLEINRYRQ